jgi:hypothetical protein
MSNSDAKNAKNTDQKLSLKKNIEKLEIKSDATRPDANMSKLEKMKFYAIHGFYKNKCSVEKINKMIDIINGDDSISLRILDWFVTRYSKRNVHLMKDGELYDVHIKYKAQLKSHKKRYFDPFKRKNKFVYTFEKAGNKQLFTTIGQLNFFYWAISDNIIDYVSDNLGQIVRVMNATNKEDKKKKAEKKQKNTKINENNNAQKNENSDETDDSDEETDIEDELTISLD